MLSTFPSVASRPTTKARTSTGATRRGAGRTGWSANPGAWTHYSYAIRDALELFACPIVEVHLSNVEEREEWRRHSVIADVVSHRVIGEGPDGYRTALQWLARHRE